MPCPIFELICLCQDSRPEKEKSIETMVLKEMPVVHAGTEAMYGNSCDGATRKEYVEDPQRIPKKISHNTQHKIFQKATHASDAIQVSNIFAK